MERGQERWTNVMIFNLRLAWHASGFVINFAVTSRGLFYARKSKTKPGRALRFDSRFRSHEHFIL